MTKATWDIETADKCELPELLPDICEKCRCYDYCHRQLTFDDLARKEEK